MKADEIKAAIVGTVIGISLGMIIIFVFGIPFFNYLISDLSKVQKPPSYKTIREVEKRIEKNINDKLRLT